MSAVRSGRIRQNCDASGGACALAGALAERGIAPLALSEGTGWTELPARKTDLPGLIAEVLASGESAELVALDRAIRVEIGSSGLHWFTTDGPLADALALLSEPENH